MINGLTHGVKKIGGDYLATFDGLGLSDGWWFYFELRIGMRDKQFEKDFMDEVENMWILRSDDALDGKDDKVKKRIPVRKLHK